jgi:nicotinic acid mononucleotide adenylyltransferase
MRRVCLFGLSANPPTGTFGHQGIVAALVAGGTFLEVWVLPVFTHAYASKRALAPFEHR